MEFRGLSKAKLEEKIEELELNLKSLRFELKTGTLTDLREYRQTKRSLAVALTVLNEIKQGVNTDLKPKKRIKVEKTTSAKKEETQSK